ncbi:MAG: hypothetical protein ABIN24_15070 [Dyadobacter sp.]
MDKLFYIRRQDRDNLGKVYLAKGARLAVKDKFQLAAAFIQEGLSLLTCDCTLGGWRDIYDVFEDKLFKKFIYTIHEELTADFHFVRAFLLSYENDKIVLEVALESIDIYNNYDNNEYGNYVKSRILEALGRPKEALEYLWTASHYDFERNSRINYRMGKLKEEYLKQCGVDFLYQAYIKNFTSSCCLRDLQKFSRIRDMGFEVEMNEDENTILKAFSNEDDEFKFQIYFENILHNFYFELESKYVETMPILEEFSKIMRSNSDAFTCFYEEDYEEIPRQNNYARDNFDALTDGQYGDYDDWGESGYDMDDLRDQIGG